MIDPIELVIGFFFVTMLFLVAVGAFVYDMKKTLKGMHNELKKQNKYLRQGTAAVITGDLGADTVTTDPAINNLPPGRTSARRRERVPTLSTSEPNTEPVGDMDATITMPRVQP